MTAASGTARTEDPDMGRTRHNRIRLTTPGSRFQPPTVGLPAGQLKDASGTACGGRAPPGP
jgi:hypothetical protein